MPELAQSAVVAVRFPGLGIVLGRHTLAVPGSHADVGVLRVAADAGGLSYTLLACLHGFTPGQAEAVRRDLAAAYGGAEIVGRPGGADVVRYTWAARDLQSPTLRALVRLQHAFGLPTARVEAGTVTLHVEASGGSARVEATLEALRRHLEAAGIPGDAAAVVDLPAAQRAALARLQALLADPAFRA